LTAPLIDLQHVWFHYGKRPVLKDISLQITQGEIVTLLGPNGCGKSTLIKVMLGILRPLKGTVRYKGSDLTGLGSKYMARQIAYVPQTHRSAFPYTVIDVALMGRIPHKTFFFKYSKEDLRIAYDALGRLSILHLAERPYTQISGGERQLAIIARALAQGARTMIMDEPASGLDYGNQLRLLEQIARLARDGYTFIKSTHSPEHALWVADRAVMIKEGQIVADGPCGEVINTENLHNLYDARVNIVKLAGSLLACVPETIGGLRGQADKTSRR